MFRDMPFRSLSLGHGLDQHQNSKHRNLQATNATMHAGSCSREASPCRSANKSLRLSYLRNCLRAVIPPHQIFFDVNERPPNNQLLFLPIPPKVFGIVSLSTSRTCVIRWAVT